LKKEKSSDVARKVSTRAVGSGKRLILEIKFHTSPEQDPAGL
jgi:hypothetical protein